MTIDEQIELSGHELIAAGDAYGMIPDDQAKAG